MTGNQSELTKDLTTQTSPVGHPGDHSSNAHDALTELHTQAFALIADALNPPAADWTNPSADRQRATLIESRVEAVKALARLVRAFPHSPEAICRALETFQTRIAELPVLYATDEPVVVFRDLNPAQADGMACVVCNATDRAQVPVGYSTSRSQVFACMVNCASAVGAPIASVR